MQIEKLQGHLPDHVYDQVPGVLSFGIDGPKRLSNFLGQCKHESANFSIVYENLNYSAQGLANTWPKRFAVNPASAIKVPNEIAKVLQRKPESIANFVYAGRMGNGDTKSGDGWKYRGMGYIQTTGADNQKAFFASIGLPADSDPSLIATTYPLASAAFFFKNNDLWTICDKATDVAAITALTNKVNGGILGLQERIQYTQEFYKILTA